LALLQRLYYCSNTVYSRSKTRQQEKVKKRHAGQ
jgi:hypothetical protein